MHENGVFKFVENYLCADRFEVGVAYEKVQVGICGSQDYFFKNNKK